MIPTPWGPRPVPPSGESAKSLILAAVVLQGIVALLALITGIVFATVLSFGAPPFYGPGLIFGGFGLFLLIDGVVLLLLTWLGYEFSYRRTAQGDYEGAKTTTLVLGILGIPFGYLVVGILYLVAYGKLGDAMTELRGGPAGYPGSPGWAYPTYGPTGYPPVGYPTPAPAPPGVPLAGANVAYAPAPSYAPPVPAAPTCPRCGRPATYIPQYNRFYCYTDQVYL